MTENGLRMYERLAHKFVVNFFDWVICLDRYIYNRILIFQTWRNGCIFNDKVGPITYYQSVKKT